MLSWARLPDSRNLQIVQCVFDSHRLLPCLWFAVLCCVWIARCHRQMCAKFSGEDDFQKVALQEENEHQSSLLSCWVPLRVWCFLIRYSQPIISLNWSKRNKYFSRSQIDFFCKILIAIWRLFLAWCWAHVNLSEFFIFITNH